MELPIDLQYMILEYLPYACIVEYLEDSKLPNYQKFIEKIYYKRLEIDVETTSYGMNEYTLTVEGILQSLRGPAKYDDSGLKQWYKNGKRHRLGGPAVTWRNAEEWFVDGKKIASYGSPWGDDSDNSDDDYYCPF